MCAKIADINGKINGNKMKHLDLSNIELDHSVALAATYKQLDDMKKSLEPKIPYEAIRQNQDKEILEELQNQNSKLATQNEILKQSLNEQRVINQELKSQTETLTSENKNLSKQVDELLVKVSKMGKSHIIREIILGIFVGVIVWAITTNWDDIIYFLKDITDNFTSRISQDNTQNK